MLRVGLQNNLCVSNVIPVSWMCGVCASAALVRVPSVGFCPVKDTHPVTPVSITVQVCMNTWINAVINIHIQMQEGHRELKWTSNMVQNQWAQPNEIAGFPLFFFFSDIRLCDVFPLAVVRWLSLVNLTNWAMWTFQSDGTILMENGILRTVVNRNGTLASLYLMSADRLGRL